MTTEQPDNQRDRAEISPVRNGADEILTPIAAVFSELVEQERQRIADQREIALRSIEAVESAEQRQHDLSLKQFEYADLQHQRRYGLGRLLLAISGVAVLVLLALGGLVMAMAFFGNVMQSQTAITMLGYAFAAIGGGGILFFIRYAVKSLTGWWQRM